VVLLRDTSADPEEANSPRDEAIDAVSTRPGEDQPNEDESIQHLVEVQEVVGEFKRCMNSCPARNQSWSERPFP
jgi:hypothetical protein